MSVALPRGRAVMTANEAAAYAVVLARVQAIGCYPITPQTLIVERLAELVAGRDDVEYANLESEHSMLGYVIAASRAGVRTFTATSSQGLLYAHEQLHRASRERVPLVMVNVNRAVFAPWSIEPDLSDSMSQRDTGWMQLYCSSAQEVLDSVLCAYRIAETAMLPVMVCAEGFLLSHTSEVVDVPARRRSTRSCPPFGPPAEWVLDPDAAAHLLRRCPEPREYAAFQRNVADAMDEARAADRGRRRRVHVALRAPEGRCARDQRQSRSAATALVTIGTIGDTARELLDGRRRPAARSRARVPAVPGRAARGRARGASHGLRRRPRGRVRLVRAARQRRQVARPRPGARRSTNVVCGVGGTEVTPGHAALGAPRGTLGRGRADRAGADVRPRGGVTVAAWLDEIVAEERLLLPGHSACAGCGPAITIRHVLGGLAAAAPEREDGAGDPGLVLDDHRRHLARQRVRGRRPPDPVRLGGGGGVGDQGGAAAARPRRHERRRLGRRRRDLRHRLLRRLGGRRAERGHRSTSSTTTRRT